MKPGTRVRLVAPTWGLTLRSDTGTIVEPSAWEGYVVVRLDEPALYDHGDAGGPIELAEIIEAGDNMQVIE